MNIKKIYLWKVNEISIKKPIAFKYSLYLMNDDKVKGLIESFTNLELKQLTYNDQLGIQRSFIYGNLNNTCYYIFEFKLNQDIYMCSSYFTYEPVLIPNVMKIPMKTIGDVISYYGFSKIILDSEMDKYIPLDSNKQLFKTNRYTLYIRYGNGSLINHVYDLYDVVGPYYTLLLLHNDMSMIERIKNVSESKLKSIIWVNGYNNIHNY